MQEQTSLTRKALPDIFFILAWLIIPNIVFAGFYTIGIGSRTAYILFYAITGTLFSLFYNKTLLIIICTIVILDLLSTVSGIFGFDLGAFGMAMKYIPMLNFREGIAFYLPLFFIILSPISLIIFSFYYRPKRPVAASAALLFLSFVLGVFEPNWSKASNDSTLFANGVEANFESSLSNMAFKDNILQMKPKKILLIMVESLGVYEDPIYWQALKEQLFAKSDKSNFIIREGTSSFFGHTTNGELRELCSRYAEHIELENQTAEFFEGCLPNILSALGYQTNAVHNFNKDFFERDTWYPKIGFQNTIFLEDMPHEKMSICKGVFVGPCDIDVLDKIIKPLMQAPSSDFIYFLTLTSHLPFVANEYTAPYQCDGDKSKFKDFQVCQLTNYFHQFFGKIGQLIADSEGDDMEIIIIGDHTPPFIRHEARSHFNEELVPWLHIKPLKNITAEYDDALLITNSSEK